MDDVAVGKFFEDAGKATEKIDLPADVTELAYTKAIYAHLRSLTEGFKKAARIVRSVMGDNALEVWRRLSRRFAPQNPEVHAKMIENLATWRLNHKASSPSEVPALLDEFEKALEDYEEQQVTRASTTPPRRS